MGYLQDKIIVLGTKKGYVTTNDIIKFYAKERIQREMNKLIAQGYFQLPKQHPEGMIWEVKK